MRVSQESLRKLAGAAVGGLLALSSAAADQHASAPRDELAAWAGNWRVRIETKETAFGHAKRENYESKCAVLPHGTFLYCDYLSLEPDASSGRTITDVALVYYSEVDKTFKYTNVAAEGGPREDVMSVDGHVWTRAFEIPTSGGGKIDAREIYEFVSADRQRARLEMSADKGAHWTVVNEAIGTRIP